MQSSRVCCAGHRCFDAKRGSTSLLIRRHGTSCSRDGCSRCQFCLLTLDRLIPSPSRSGVIRLSGHASDVVNFRLQHQRRLG